MDDHTRKDAGTEAEDTALRFLISQGLKLIARNYRCRGGEIDLVMLDGKTLVLVEVRLRTSERFGGAAASVDRRKQRRIILAARHLLTTRNDLRRYRARFDVIAVSGGRRFPVDIEWIKDAFVLDR